MSEREFEKDEQEALKIKLDEKEEEKVMAMWDCGSPLYDSYELVSLDHHINKNLMSFPSHHGSKFTNTSLVHNYEDMIHVKGSLEKTKEFIWVTSFKKFLLKIIKRKDGKERRKKNKEMRRLHE
ncbi:unnamed protein product [Lathyrus oleraceus]